MLDIVHFSIINILLKTNTHRDSQCQTSSKLHPKMGHDDSKRWINFQSAIRRKSHKDILLLSRYISSTALSVSSSMYYYNLPLAYYLCQVDRFSLGHAKHWTTWHGSPFPPFFLFDTFRGGRLETKQKESITDMRERLSHRIVVKRCF